MTNKALYRGAKSTIAMSKDKIHVPKSETEYRKLKASCNAYERAWRKSHPLKHEMKSKELIHAIVKNRTPKKKSKKVKPEVVNTA